MIKINWFGNVNRVDELVNIFLNNTGIEYITHIEIEEGRALSINEWSPNLKDILRDELITEMAKSKVIVAEDDGIIKGYALLKLENKILTIEDIVVNQKGIGTEIMEWIEKEMVKNGIKRLMADLGVKNKRAQEFMKKLGYEAQTIVYVKNINKEGLGK